MSDVTFAPIEEENPDQEQIIFNAEMDGEAIECAITYDALKQHYEADYSDPLFAFMTARSQIEEIAEKLIKQQRLSDNKLVITSQDCSDNKQ